MSCVTSVVVLLICCDWFCSVPFGSIVAEIKTWIQVIVNKMNVSFYNFEKYVHDVFRIKTGRPVAKTESEKVY